MNANQSQTSIFDLSEAKRARSVALRRQTSSTFAGHELDFQDTHPEDLTRKSVKHPEWMTEKEVRELPLYSCGKRDISDLVISKIEKAYPTNNLFSSIELAFSNRRRLFAAYVFLLNESKVG